MMLKPLRRIWKKAFLSTGMPLKPMFFQRPLVSPTWAAPLDKKTLRPLSSVPFVRYWGKFFWFPIDLDFFFFRVGWSGREHATLPLSMTSHCYLVSWSLRRCGTHSMGKGTGKQMSRWRTWWCEEVKRLINIWVDGGRWLRRLWRHKMGSKNLSKKITSEWLDESIMFDTIHHSLSCTQGWWSLSQMSWGEGGLHTGRIASQSQGHIHNNNSNHLHSHLQPTQSCQGAWRVSSECQRNLEGPENTGWTCKLDMFPSDQRSLGGRRNIMKQFCSTAGGAIRRREPSRNLLLRSISAQLLGSEWRGQRRPLMPPPSRLVTAPLIGPGAKASAL